ncbi:DUF2853 family protein [Aureibaculum marinum]|uniref:DUF2853 family protein n=1 Tax=Aureibaculum marinum TaxID=2487930 RepID=A0A3N4NQG8_9FLAO|nr:DUF2853 family protein [Aureibaculum marinum]RPD98622.1 DUF2853 family protein [Aureibaculum marinum]
MSELAEKLAKLKEQAESQLKDSGVSNIDNELLDDLVGRMRLIVNNKDAILVSGTDPAELETVRKNFVEKKLGVDDKDKAMAAIKKVAEKMSGIRQKNRVAFYYMVQKELKK